MANDVCGNKYVWCKALNCFRKRDYSQIHHVFEHCAYTIYSYVIAWNSNTLVRQVEGHFQCSHLTHSINRFQLFCIIVTPNVLCKHQANREWRISVPNQKSRLSHAYRFDYYLFTEDFSTTTVHFMPLVCKFLIRIWCHFYPPEKKKQHKCTICTYFIFQG